MQKTALKSNHHALTSEIPLYPNLSLSYKTGTLYKFSPIKKKRGKNQTGKGALKGHSSKWEKGRKNNRIKGTTETVGSIHSVLEKY